MIPRSFYIAVSILLVAALGMSVYVWRMRGAPQLHQLSPQIERRLRLRSPGLRNKFLYSLPMTMWEFFKRNRPAFLCHRSAKSALKSCSARC